MLRSTDAAISPLQYSQQSSNKRRWLRELGELLAFPTISAQPRHQRDIWAAAHWLEDHLIKLGLHHVQILPGPNSGHPSVYGDWRRAPGQPTLLLYGHYDVQPVDPAKECRTRPFPATPIGQHRFATAAAAAEA